MSNTNSSSKLAKKIKALPTSRIVDGGMWILLLALAIAFALIYSNFVQDDAYITFRYARNLSAGMGFVYNAGERVLGTTTPLFTLLLTLIRLITGADVVLISLILCALSLWISSGILYTLCKTPSRLLGLAVALVFATNPFLPHFMGMESYFLLALLFLSIWSYQKGKSFTASILCGLLVLVRYEMGILMAVIAIIDFTKSRKLPLWLVPGLLPVLAWVVFAALYFGTPIPLSATAKLAATRVAFPVGFAFYVYSFFTASKAWLLVIILFLIGIVSFIFKKKLSLGQQIILIFSIAYFLVASLIAGSFPWYYAPLLPAIAIAVVAGVDTLSQAAVRLSVRIKNFNWQLFERIIGGGLAALVVFVQMIFWQQAYVQYRHTPFDHRFVAFQQASVWLNEHASPGASITLNEIGYIGYFTGMTVVDLSSLVSPGLLPLAGAGQETALEHSLDLYSTDYVLIDSQVEQLVKIMAGQPGYALEAVFTGRYQLYAKDPEM